MFSLQPLRSSLNVCRWLRCLGSRQQRVYWDEPNVDREQGAVFSTETFSNPSIHGWDDDDYGDDDDGGGGDDGDEDDTGLNASGASTK